MKDWLIVSSRQVIRLLLILAVLILYVAVPRSIRVEAATFAQLGGWALDFNGTDAYVTFGPATSLGLQIFTLETWFRRDGPGQTTTTGVGGITDGIPLIAKGRDESDGSNLDLNYFLGIRESDDVLVADFEQGPGGQGVLGKNYPVAGVTPIINGRWYHAAATYDGTTWRLYLNGNLEAKVYVGQPPRSDSIQHASLATAMDSNGTPAGFFDGALDEVRIWGVERTRDEIRASMNSEISGPQSGLVARWGLNEGSGTTVVSSSDPPIAGTVVGTGYVWAEGAPFNLPVNHPPNQPTDEDPADGAPGVSTSPDLEVEISDPDGDDTTVTFYGKVASAGPAQDFVLVVLPDTQKYTSQIDGGTPEMFISQTQWIVAHRVLSNVVAVTHLGDIVENGDLYEIEWQHARDAMYLLDDPNVPYGLVVGNRDNLLGTTTYFNQYFGITHFTGRSYYGGHFGSNNNNHYVLFSSGGLDFIMIHLEHDGTPDPLVLNWADGLLKTHRHRRAIVVSHYIIETGGQGIFSVQGRAIYDVLKDNPNFFLMLCGHISGEGRRQDIYNGNTVYSLLSNYQSRPNGGGGLLRIMQFSPANNLIRIRTYSPWTNEYENDWNSQFELPYNMARSGFQVIGTNTGVASGTETSVEWPSLAYATAYQWYVTVDDGEVVTTGPVWTFTTSRPAVAVAKAPDAASAHVGQTITYTYRVTNTGEVTLKGVQAYDDRLGVVPLSTDRLTPNQVATGTLTHTVREEDLPGPLVNRVVVTGTVVGAGVVSASHTAQVEVIPLTPIPKREHIYLPIVRRE